MAFVYAYIQCLDGPVNWFSLTFCILIQVFLLLTVTLRGVSNKHCLLPLFHSSWIRTLVAMATYSFNRLIMVKVEIGNFYCLIGDNRILFLQKCLLNSSLLL